MVFSYRVSLSIFYLTTFASFARDAGMQKILITRLSSMGDIVLTTPVIRALRRRFSDAQIDYVTKQEFAELVQTNPHLTNIYPYDSRSGFAGLRALGRQLRGQRYDLMVDLHNKLRSRLLQAMVRPRQTVRFSKYFVKRTLLVKTGLNLYIRPITQVPDRYLRPLQAFGVKNDDVGLELFPTEEHYAKVATIFRQHHLTDDEFVIGLGPVASFPLKQWPVERFAEVGQELVRRYHARVLLFGGPPDVPLVEPLTEKIPHDPILLCGQLTMIESAAALQRCALFVGNDTGTAHFAAAMGCKVVEIFGPTTEELGFYPYNVTSEVVSKPLPCRPCTHTGKGKCRITTHACMQDIQAEDVVNAVKRLL
jgi:heptosyltransferase-2